MGALGALGALAAGHGTWGIGVARKNPGAALFALDWPAVLEVARENARAAGLGDRFHTITGNAFEVDLGTGYDLVLIPNFLHHFNTADCVRFLRKTHAALRPGGRVAIVEFVPNPDRITPPPGGRIQSRDARTTSGRGTPTRLPNSRGCSATPVFNARPSTRSPLR